jgi:UDP-N-acetylglucosamine 4-epimerase
MEKKSKILITGGAGFIGSNLCEYFVNEGFDVVCLDNFATGFKHNLNAFINAPNFKLIEGDIRDLETCRLAVENCDYVLHQAALGSVPRSINDPITTNEVNINGFLNMLIASRDEKVKRFIYAASSSTYGDSKSLPKVEDIIGVPQSPYAITKYVNELYAQNFSKLYEMETIGLRYFNVFGKRQDPKGAYAAVIPKFVIQLVNHESPVINGNVEFSRDFTHVDNVVLMNSLAIQTTNPEALNTVFNTAFGERTTLLELVSILKYELSQFDSSINNIDTIIGPSRIGDIPHSIASIDKAKLLLGYNPKTSLKNGISKTIQWYWENLNNQIESNSVS